MRYFLDTEFDDDGETIMPISLGMISQDARSLYIEFDFDEDRARRNDFVRENVLTVLTGQKRLSKAEARDAICEFMGLPKYRAESSRSPIEVWAYFAASDWVVFYQLWGGLLNVPKGMPHHCMDLQQWWVQLDRPIGIKGPKPKGAHNALVDAGWNLALHERLAGCAELKSRERL